MLKIQKEIYDFLSALEYEIKADNLHFKYDVDLEEFLIAEKIKFEKIRTE